MILIVIGAFGTVPKIGKEDGKNRKSTEESICPDNSIIDRILIRVQEICGCLLSLRLL